METMGFVSMDTSSPIGEAIKNSQEVPKSSIYLNSELWKGEDLPLSYDLYKKSCFTSDTKICTSQCHLNYLPFFHTSQYEELNGFKEKSSG